MQKKQEVDMLHGPLLGKIVRFALPIAFSAFLQQLFSRQRCLRIRRQRWRLWAETRL